MKFLILTLLILFGFNSSAGLSRIGLIEELVIVKGNINGRYIVSKFGQNTDVDAAEDIWDGGGDFTGFPTSSPEAFQVLSSDPDDDFVTGNGAKTLRIYYFNNDYEMFDSNFEPYYFDVNLDGTVPVSVVTTGMRVWRAKVILSGSSQTNTGNITVRWATTTSVIFTVIQAGQGQSEITAFTIPSGYIGFLKRRSSYLNDNNSNRAEMAIKVRDFGSNTFRLIRPYVITNVSPSEKTLFGGQRFDEKTDFVFRAKSVSSTNAVITSDWELYLTKK